MPRPVRSLPAPRGTRLVLCLAAVHAVLMSLLVPPWMGEDEPWHLESALWVARGEVPRFTLAPTPTIPEEVLWGPVSPMMIWRRFADAPYERLAESQAEQVAALADSGFERRVDWAPDVRGTTSFDALNPAITAADEPSLYALVLGLWLKPFTGLSLEAQLTLARVPSVFAYLLAVWTALRLGQRLGRGSALPVLAGLIAALWPMHARQAAVVSNDVLAKVALSLALLAALALSRGRGGWLRRGGFLALLSALPFAKPTAISALTLAPVALLTGARRARHVGRLAAKLLAVVLALGTVAALALAKSPTLPKGLPQFIARAQQSLSEAGLTHLARTLVGYLGWEQRLLPAWCYTLGALFAAVAVAGLALIALRAVAARLQRGPRSTRAPFDRASGALVLALVLAVVLAQLALVALRGVTAGRYLSPATAPFAVLLAAGWLALVPARHARLAVGACALLLGVLGIGFFVFGLLGAEWLRFAA